MSLLLFRPRGVAVADPCVLDFAPLADDALGISTLADGTLVMAVRPEALFERAAFPSTGILDAFNRGDEEPVTGWTDFPSGSGLKIVSNQLASATVAGTQDGAYFNAAIPSPDVEAYVTIPTLPSHAGSTVLYARADPDAGGVVGDNYAVRHTVNTSGTDLIFLSRHDATVATTLATFSQELAAGDALGIRCVGSIIEAWARISGTWTFIGQAEDSTYAGDGTHNKLAITHFEATGPLVRWDDFGGGAMVHTLVPSADAALTLTPLADDLLTISEAECN